MSHFWRGFYKVAGLKEVATVGVFDGDKILMGKRRDNDRWTNPGGHLEPGENPEEGAKREVLEEAGIKLDKIHHLKTETITTPKGERLIIHAYKAAVDGAKTTMKDDPDQEVYRWHWIDTSKGLPEEQAQNLHSPKNVLLKALGLQQEKTAEYYFPGTKIHDLPANNQDRNRIERTRESYTDNHTQRQNEELNKWQMPS